MKNSKSKRILFIMFFPVVFVLIMLTIGLPQQLLTAATVGTEKFKPITATSTKITTGWAISV